MPWEGIEQAMVREFSEETGLNVIHSRLKFEYFSHEEIPVNLAVFEVVEAEGQLRSSWEGTPCWLPATALRQRLLASQKRIVDGFHHP